MNGTFTSLFAGIVDSTIGQIPTVYIKLSSAQPLTNAIKSMAKVNSNFFVFICFLLS